MVEGWFWGEPSGVSAISPGSLSGLAYWWKADALSLTDGTAVGSWTDSSSHAWVASQSITSQKPIFRSAPTGFGGKPALQFTRTSSQQLQAAYNATLNPAAMTVVAVFQSSTLVLTNRILSSHDESAGTTGYQLVLPGSPAGSVEGLLRSSGGAATVVCGTIAAASTTHWITVTTTGSGTNAFGYLDSVVSGVAQTGTLAVNTTDPLIIGADPNFGSGSSFDGYIAEIFALNRVVTDAERAGLDVYVSDKYSLPYTAATSFEGWG